jgi:hypothetical protein
MQEQAIGFQDWIMQIIVNYVRVHTTVALHTIHLLHIQKEEWNNANGHQAWRETWVNNAQYKPRRLHHTDKKTVYQNCKRSSYWQSYIVVAALLMIMMETCHKQISGENTVIWQHINRCLFPKRVWYALNNCTLFCMLHPKCFFFESNHIFH